MRTDDLIAALSDEPASTRSAAVMPWLGAAAAVGGLVAFLNVTAWLGLQPLDVAMRSRWFWMKGGYTLCLAGAGLVWVARLCRPGEVATYAPYVALAAVAALAAMAGMNTLGAPPNLAASQWLGQTWSVCSFYIVVLSAPIFVAVVWVMRRLAPTRLVLAGAVAGAFSGAVAATIYGLHCPESTAAFVVTWYTLGIAAAGGLGAITGPRLLRW